MREAFLELHVPGEPLLIPNPWDAGSARLMERLGARALATTSSAFAAALGRPDGGATRDEVLLHAEALVQAVGVPVSADLENGYADELEQLAETYRAASAAGLAGASLEDWSGSALYPLEQATERVAAVRQAAPRLVLTARAEGYLHGEPDLAGAIRRLQAYAEVGADVLYAPGVTDATDLATLVREVDRPVNALLLRGMSVGALADAGVARVSVGGALGWVAWDAVAQATRSFLAGGADWLDAAAAGRDDALRTVG